MRASAAPATHRGVAARLLARNPARAVAPCRAAGALVRACSAQPRAQGEKSAADAHSQPVSRETSEGEWEGKNRDALEVKSEMDAIRDEEAKEKLAGRLAVLLLGAVLLGERITGEGAVQALDLAVNVPLWEIEPLLALMVLGLVAAAVMPSKKKFERSWAAYEDARGDKKKWLRKVQGASGRLACLGLASTIVAEVTTGKGALALLNVETGVETLNEIEAGLAFLVMLFLSADDTDHGQA